MTLSSRSSIDTTPVIRAAMKDCRRQFDDASQRAFCDFHASDWDEELDQCEVVVPIVNAAIPAIREQLVRQGEVLILLATQSGYSLREVTDALVRVIKGDEDGTA